jgi:hypothetical protein
MKKFHPARAARRTTMAILAIVASWAALVLGAAVAHAETPAADLPPAVADALQASLAQALPEGRLEVVGWKASGASCVPASATVSSAVAGSGRYAVKVQGDGCGAWGWATVRVFAPAFITTRSVRLGEPLDGAVKSVDQEVRPGRVPAPVNPGSKAARALTSGQLVEASHLEATGPKPGSTVKVMVHAGSLSISQYGRAISCGRGRICAVLPSGKHVEGELEGDVLQVVLP